LVSVYVQLALLAAALLLLEAFLRYLTRGRP
jgi:hypothetical protein